MFAFLKDANMIAILGGVCVIVVMGVVWWTFIERDPFNRRYKLVTQRRAELEEEGRKKVSRRQNVKQISLMKQIVEWLKLTQASQAQELKLKLIRAGFRGRDAVTIFVFLKLVAMIGLGLAAFILTFVTNLIKVEQSSMQLLIIVGATALGYMLPDILVKSQKQKREEVLRRGLPDALDLMVICAEAGLSLDSTFDRVSREINGTCPALSEEMGLTGVELSLLPERSKALQGLASRVDIPGIMALVNTLIQTERYGTPLAQALRVLAAEMRDERIMRAEEKAARLPATLTVPMILFILPTLFIVLVGPAGIKVSQTLGR
jgi:tight adherence protein C